MPQRLPSSPPILPGLAYIRPLGSGGFADVFLYGQDMPRRDVAVKVLPSDVRDTDLLRMFNAEADVLAHLSAHPSIVTVYQAGISADGRPYIVMEFCPGSLAQRYRVERMPVPEVLSIGVRMSGALESAHHAGLIHRDVKPSNILVTTFGAPVLADFGISSSLVRQGADEMLAMSVPWSAPRSSPSRRPEPCRARCGASAPRSTLCSRGRAPSNDARRGRTPASSCDAASLARPTPTSPAATSPPRCRRCSRSRCPATPPTGTPARVSSARRSRPSRSRAACPRRRSRSPPPEWAPAARRSISPTGRCAARRGRASSARVGASSAAPPAWRAMSRDEDTDIAAPASTGSKALPWILARRRS